MKHRRLILPWAALGGALVALGALLVERLGIWHREPILLWPTYQLLHLEIWHGAPWTIALFVLIVQALVWTVILSTCAFVARWLMPAGEKQRAA